MLKGNGMKIQVGYNKVNDSGWLCEICHFPTVLYRYMDNYKSEICAVSVKSWIKYYIVPQKLHLNIN